MADLPNNQAPGTVRTLYAYTKHGYVYIAKREKLPNGGAMAPTESNGRTTTLRGE